MLNNTKKYIVYLDPDTLEYMFLTYTERRNYPVMRKLFAVLREGFTRNLLVSPLSLEHLYPYIEENKIDRQFLNMMGEFGQVQFLQRFTVRTLQLIRVVNFFFEQMYKKDPWKDAFSSDPDERYTPGFNKYHSITAQNILTALEREKKLSQVYDFIEKFKTGRKAGSIASDYYRFLWDQFPDVMRPYLPVDGDPDEHMAGFFSFEDIKDIPEFHIISNTLYPLFETYGIQDIEFGLKDDILLAAETAAAYVPYCHYFVTASDIAELFLINGISEIYNVKIYDNNESSLYKLIDDIKEALDTKKRSSKKETGKSIFSRGGPKNYY